MILRLCYENGKDCIGNRWKHEKMVEITLKTIGPAHPSRLHVLSSIRVLDLKKLIIGKNRLPLENLKLILQRKVLYDCEDEDDIYIKLNDGDSLIVARGSFGHLG